MGRQLSFLLFLSHQGLLEIVGLNAAYEVGLARVQCFHEGIQRLAELARQSRDSFLVISCLLPETNKCQNTSDYTQSWFCCCCTDPEAVLGRAEGHPGVGATRACSGGQIVLKSLLEELVGRGFHKLNQVWAEGVTVFLQKTSTRDKHDENTTEAVHPERFADLKKNYLSNHSRPLQQNAWFQTVSHSCSWGKRRPCLSRVHHLVLSAGCYLCPENEEHRDKTRFALSQQNTARSKEDRDLGEVAFFINKSQHVHRFAGKYIQGALVVFVVNVLPNYVFTGVLVLLQLEDMPDKELLQLLVGKVDAQLLKAASAKQCKIDNGF